MPTAPRVTNCYINLTEFKQTIYPAAQSTDTADDAVIRRVIENISRTLDRWWEGRHYFPFKQTKVLQALSSDLLKVPDLLSVTTLKTDDSGDRSYGTTWAADDYDLLPFDAPNQPSPRPYTSISPAPNGAFRFPRYSGAVQLTGTFGYYNIKRTATSTLTGDINDSTTTVPVTAGTEFAIGMVLTIGTEMMFVQSIATNDLTVVRAANGTTAAEHDLGDAISIQEFPVVSEAATILAARIFKRKDAPFGVVGSAELGQMMVIARQDPDVKLLMQNFRRLSI